MKIIMMLHDQSRFAQEKIKSKINHLTWVPSHKQREVFVFGDCRCQEIGESESMGFSQVVRHQRRIDGCQVIMAF
jgi:hypothetical protein